VCSSDLEILNSAATSYRAGRVFLCGDASHVHSPAGGQGMNTGLQDAANLGWKLAAAVKGEVDLLDTYQTERHPVGTMVLRTSGAIIRLALIRSAPARALRNAVLGTALRIRPVARRAAGTISGIDIRYPRKRGEHPLTGRRAADRTLPDGRRLYEALRDGRFVLVDGRLLVRPDGYVAWAGDPADAAGAIERWRGRGAAVPR